MRAVYSGLVGETLEFLRERSIPTTVDVQSISLEPLENRSIAILGYGNQGRAQALNLRDSGVAVKVGARPGGAAEALAKKDGFSPFSLEQAARDSEIVAFLLPDHEIPGVYKDLSPILLKKFLVFAHGFSLHFRSIEILPSCSYFLVAPKGAGAVLRWNFEKGSGLPMIYAIGPNENAQTLPIAFAYAKAIGAVGRLLKTSFQEETECDLFGEQVVLCGGLMALMQEAYEVLVEAGHQPEMAFYDCCYEVKTIIDLYLLHGPGKMGEKISAAAFFGGMQTGKRLINADVKEEIRRVFSDIRSGKFATLWQKEREAGSPNVESEKKRLANSKVQKGYEKLKSIVREF